MKNWCLVVIASLSCSVMYPSSAPDAEILSSKVILQNTNGYFVLSDRSCWKVIGFSPRWRSLSEWWNNVQLVPENYECVPNDWYLGTEIDVYSKYGNLQVSEANASNQEALKQCTHLFVNRRTGQVLFAIALEPAQCILDLHRDAHQDGYDEGYSFGRRAAHNSTAQAYENGHSDGYKVGYREGYQAGQRSSEALINDILHQ
ncbi:MAG: hypothetical protein JSS61_05585 [Verrucomicrobia bacterium]|nr:hypothetical protein [Verrucomicrobiota bacterium]